MQFEKLKNSIRLTSKKLGLSEMELLEDLKESIQEDQIMAFKRDLKAGKTSVNKIAKILKISPKRLYRIYRSKGVKFVKYNKEKPKDTQQADDVKKVD